MPKKSPRSSLQDISPVLIAQSDSPSAAKALQASAQALAKAGYRGKCLVVADPSQAMALRKLPQLRRLKAEVLEAPASEDSWSAFHAASLKAASRWLLLLPPGSTAKAPQLKGLKAKASSLDWVLLRSGEQPSWLRRLLEWGLGMEAPEMGSASLVRREVLASAARLYPASAPLLGPRLLRAACAAGARVAEIPAPGQARTLGAAQALGLEPLAFWQKLQNRAASGLFCLALTAFGFIIYSRSPSLGLTLVGVGFIALFSIFGRSEA